jgi:hypothetical protein
MAEDSLPATPPGRGPPISPQSFPRDEPRCKRSLQVGDDCDPKSECAPALVESFFPSIGHLKWVSLVFPLWVHIDSVHVLVENYRGKADSIPVPGIHFS